MATRLKFDVPRHLYPFEHRYADLGNGIEMHYVDEGEGETLLMLHGNPTWSFLYRKMISRLGGDFRCIAPDREVLGMYLAPFRRRADRKQTSISPRQLTKAADYLSTVEDGLGRIRDRPTLLTWGVKDFAFREAARQRFEAAFPDHKTVLLDASHFWQEDAGEEAADAIREWMRG